MPNVPPRTLGDPSTLPDGPNVGPSPYEHLAAQGVKMPPQTPPANEPPPKEVDPAEQELVDEQREHDRKASEQTSPPTSAPRA